MAIRVRKEKQMHKVFIVAEAGVNHNGSVKIAKKMVDVAVNAGADAVKFQTFDTRPLVSKNAPKAEYQMKTTSINESQLQMIKKLELGINIHRELLKYCRKNKIVFLSSPFDLKSVDLLVKLGLRVFKIPSGEITNLPYLRRIGSLKNKVIISTGAANVSEIRLALDILIKAGTKKKDITVLQCNTAYPTPACDANLLAMCTIRKVFNVKVGYSDHTQGIEIPIAAAALGAVIIEKHFTLDKNMEGPDHKASLNPEELKSMVNAIRKIEKALGDGIKKPSVSELENRIFIRKSIVAGIDIKKKDVFTEQNITTKRSATGLSPMEWDNVIGRVAKRNFQEDEKIEL